MGPEKRLPFALFTCFVLIVGLQLLNAPAQVSEEDRAALEQQIAGEESPAPVVPAADASEEDAPEQPAVDAWDEWLTFGAPGEPGYMQVHFDSYGGSVSEIRLGNHFTRVGFDEAERADRENWVRLVRPGVARGRGLHDPDGPARGRDREAHGRGSLEGALAPRGPRGGRGRALRPRGRAVDSS